MARIDKRFGATDGWIRMPDGTRHYIFGFVDLTGVPEERLALYRGRATLPGPLLEVGEGDEVYLTLTNLGFPGRPELDDTHTIHWHGFPNQIPLWDGVPEASISVPVGRSFTYYFKPANPGTYMYHCHFEPVEHIQMGMLGPLIVRPALEKNPPLPAGFLPTTTRLRSTSARSSFCSRSWTPWPAAGWPQPNPTTGRSTGRTIG